MEFRYVKQRKHFLKTKKMEETNESSRRRIKMENLLQRFITSTTTSNTIKPKQEQEEDEIELNLGLSLGGRFGVDKTSAKLFRSTSVASSIPMMLESNGEEVAAFMSPAALIRTSSLPTETEEEWRKRKELQSLRRLEAKRRRSEKIRSLNSVKLEKDVVGPPSNSVRQSCGGMEFGDRGKGCYFGQLNSQGSAGSSGMSDFESKQVQGATSGGETRSPVSNQTLKPEPRNQETMQSPGTTPKRADIAESLVGKKSGMSAVDEMPCVFTRGEGPNGRRIDGILYKYGKGEAVRIMCVCHGSFLSPAEFVKHAGGVDVAHPLRHIVVNPNSNSLL